MNKNTTSQIKDSMAHYWVDASEYFLIMNNMPVYVDDMKAGFGRMIMCHMIADSTDELLEMARNIGVASRWVQYQGSWKEHFDICKSKRQKAISLGAIEISQRELYLKLEERKPHA